MGKYVYLYRVDFYSTNPHLPDYTEYLDSGELAELISYYKGIYTHYSKRRVGRTIYLDFFDSDTTDELYLVISEE